MRVWWCLCPKRYEVDTPHPETGATALCVAAQWGHLKLVKKLLSIAADINAHDSQGRDALCVRACVYVCGIPVFFVSTV